MTQDDLNDIQVVRYSKPGVLYRLMNLFGGIVRPNVDLFYDENERPAGTWSEIFSLPQDRTARYEILRQMDTFDSISTVLDMYAEESTQPDPDTGQTVWVETKSNSDVRAHVNVCLRNLQVDQKAPGIVREMCQYGDRFLRTIYSTGKGVLGWEGRAANKMTRVSDKFNRLVGFKESGVTDFRPPRKSIVSWPWDYVHFRLSGKMDDSGYGTSAIAGAFRAWRTMSLGEDATLAYRLRRSPERNMIFVDVGAMPEDQAVAYLNGWRKRLRRLEFIDPACVALHQRVRTLGGDKSVQEIINAFHAGQDTWVYSYDEKQRKIVPGKVTWAGVTRRNAKLVEITLDDGATVTCTPDHKIAVMNGTPTRHGPRPDVAATEIRWVEAQDLKPGMQLVPLRRGSHIKGGRRRYETIIDPFGGWGFTHRRVCDAVDHLRDGMSKPNAQCHHVDENTLNNAPENLEAIPASTHTRRHNEKKHATAQDHRTCPECGQHFVTVRSSPKVYCTSRCAYNNADPTRFPKMRALYARRTSERAVFRACDYCGVEYKSYRRLLSSGKGHYCSHACAATARWKTRRGLVPVPNHTVAEVREVEGRHDTGDLTVAGLGNFFVVDHGTGGVLVHNSSQYRRQYNPLTPMEDMFIPFRENDQTRIETLAGGGDVGQIYDLNYSVSKFAGAVRVPRAYLGFEGDLNAKCGDLRTKIPCLDGRVRTLKQIIDRYEKDGWTPYVYSYDLETQKIVPGKVEWAGITKRHTRVLEVELDDGTKHRFTPEHKWFMLDGTQLRTDQLRPGMQLLPLRVQTRKYGGRPYRKLYDPNGGCQWLHRRVAETVYPNEIASTPDNHVHHVDRRWPNNDPRNLQVLSADAHLETHKIEKVRTLSKHRKSHGVWNKGVKKGSGHPLEHKLRPTTYVSGLCLNCGAAFEVPKTRDHKKFCSSGCAGEYGARSRVESGRVVTRCHFCEGEFETTRSRLDAGKSKFCCRTCLVFGKRASRIRQCEYCASSYDPGTRKSQRFCSQGCAQSARYKTEMGMIPVPNHTVVNVREVDELIDTGDITVTGYHNFFIADATGGGVLVHNSTLAQQDVRFARTIKNIQRSFLYGVRTAVEMHLAIVGDKVLSEALSSGFVLKMSAPSFLDEFERLELMRLRSDIMQAYAQLGETLRVDPSVWATHILLNYAKLPEELVTRLITKPAAPPPGEDGTGELDRSPPSPGGESVQGESRGFYPLSAAEQISIAKMMHASPALRKVVGDLAFYFEDDLHVAQEQQRDLSYLRPQFLTTGDDGKQQINEVAYGSGDDDTADAKTLASHLRSDRAGPING